MKLTRLLIAAAVLAVLSGALWWSNRAETAKASKLPADTTPKLLELKEANIKGLEIQKRGEPPTVLKKNDQNQWSIVAPQPLTTDQAAVSSITSAASNLNADRLVDDNATDLAGYGLDPAAVTVTFTTADGKNPKLLIGDDSPVGGNVYAKLAGDKRLYTMSSSNKTTFDKGAKDLREKHLMVFDQDKLSRVELNPAKKPPVEFGKTGQNDWQILKPRPMRADSLQVEELIRKVKDTTMEADSDPKTDSAAFASGQPVGVVKLTTQSGTLTMEVRKSKDSYYAKSSALEGVYKVNKDLGEGMDKSVDDFRNKKLFDFGFNDPSRVEFKESGKSTVIEKSGDKWTSGGKTMDSISVQNLIDKLRDLAATKFADKGFTTPEIELTVVSMDGKRTENVQIASAAGGKTNLAKRSDDSSLYEIDSSAVQGLRDAVAGVKPAAPEPAPAGKK